MDGGWAARAAGGLPRSGMSDTRSVNDELHAIPPARRRRMALALAPLGLALLVAGVLAMSLDGIGWTLTGLLVAALALVLVGVAWGLRRSAALSEAATAEERLDEVLVTAAGASGVTCGGAGADGADSYGSHGSGRSICGATGVACGSSSEPGGCGATCLARTR